MDKILVVIPARGGSKGLPGKNIKPLCGKPLIEYSIDVARAITSDDNICVSTDDQKIIDVVEEYGLHVPFVRPAELASDTASIGMYHSGIDMVVSVTKSHAPAVLCSDNTEGYVNLVYNKHAGGRQSLPTFYEFNGAIYVINVEALKNKGLGNFNKRIKYVMSKETSIDIDDIYDFMLIESIFKKK